MEWHNLIYGKWVDEGKSAVRKVISQELMVAWTSMIQPQNLFQLIRVPLNPYILEDSSLIFKVIFS